MRFYRHTLAQVLVAAGADAVIGGADIPSESSLNNVWGDVHVVAIGHIEEDKAVIYGVDGKVLHVPDPDTPGTYDQIWDLIVPKDQDFAAGALDLDIDSGAGPAFEPGEPNIERLMDMSEIIDQNDFFKRRKMISMASRPVAFVDGTPDNYLPTDQFSVRSRKKIFVDLWSVAVLAVSSPSMDDVTTTSFVALNTEAELMQIKYLEMTLEQAWMQLVGLVEAGAETPWEDAATLVEQVLEPTVVEITAGDFAAPAWNVFANLTWEVQVPGRRNFSNVSAA